MLCTFPSSSVGSRARFEGVRMGGCGWVSGAFIMTHNDDVIADNMSADGYALSMWSLSSYPNDL